MTRENIAETQTEYLLLALLSGVLTLAGRVGIKRPSASAQAAPNIRQSGGSVVWFLYVSSGCIVKS